MLRLCNIYPKGTVPMIFEGFSTENKRLVQNITTSAQTLNKDIFESHSERLASRGGHFKENELIPVYFAALVGVPTEKNDRSQFRNMLYELKEDLIKSPKFLLYVENEFTAPTAEELSGFEGIDISDSDSIISAVTEKINIPQDEIRTGLAKETLPLLLKNISGDELLVKARTLVIKLNRCLGSKAYTEHREQEIPVLLYYGGITEDTVMFLHFMSRLGIDVIYICSSKDPLPMLAKNNLEGRMQIFELSDSEPVSTYPDKPVRTKLATAAYNASKELNDILYSGDTMFRDHQFENMRSVTLSTTYEEIDILWHQQSKYRTGFKAEKDIVDVPTIFAKISGVKDGDTDEYWDDVKRKLSPYTRLIYKSPSYKNIPLYQLDVYKQFYDGEKIFADKLKNSPCNKYSFLSDSLQNLIFGKLQEAVDSKLITLPTEELMPMIIYVGTNIEREILKLLQKYDFTKDIPKLIVIDVIEETFSKIECIQLVLYNLLGFDVLVYTPTGYKNIESFVSSDAFETHTMNEFLYNIRVPKLKIPDTIPDPDGGGLFGKLFKKGRK